MVGRVTHTPLTREEKAKLNQLDLWKDLLALSCPEPLTRGTSKYTGVSWHAATRKWKAQIQSKGRNYYAGVHSNEEDAALAVIWGRFYMSILCGGSVEGAFQPNPVPSLQIVHVH